MNELREFFRKSIDYRGSDEDYNREVWQLAEIAGKQGVDGTLMMGRGDLSWDDVERAWKYIHRNDPKPPAP